jgi:hypothetical protein
MATEFNYKRKDPNEYDSVKTAKENMDKYSTYTDSESVTNAKNLASQNQALKPADWDTDLMSKGKLEAYDKWANRPDFSYDVNGDALYQQYKDQYINQGRMAMMDTMGQAAAMTGGYGNSYAASVGNQAYQGYLQKLNEVVPDLYNMAYNMYQQEGEDLKYAYDVARDEYNTKYGEWADKLGFWQSEQSRLDTNAYNEANLDRSMWESDRSHYTGLYNTALEWATNNENTLYNDAATKYQLDQQKRQADAAEEAKRIAESAKTGGLTAEMTAAEIVDQLQAYKDNGDNVGLSAFLDILETDGVISEEKADSYYDKYVVEKTENQSLTEWLKRLPSWAIKGFLK